MCLHVHGATINRRPTRSPENRVALMILAKRAGQVYKVISKAKLLLVHAIP